MEKHKCKLCSRKFANGRALGGHMRSHLMILPIPSKPDDQPSREAESLTESLLSWSSSSSDSEEEDIKEEENDYDDDEEKELKSYKLKGNPRKSIKLADLEDRESETESTRNPTRLRSKRGHRRPSSLSFDNENEPASSISEVTSEEDLAFCLMMLSRDKWTCHGRDYGDDVTNSYDTTTKKIKGINNFTSFRSKYRCETCNKIFKSYQALGGHRASHKKVRVAANTEPNNDDNNNDNISNNKNEADVKEKQQRKIHECPVCFRVFLSRQALGGHKRSHVIGDNIENSNQNPPNNEAVHSKKIKKENNTILIDLNLPAPVDDDDEDDEEISQIVVSAVYDVHL